MHRVLVRQGAVAARHLHAMRAQITAAAFEQGQSNGQVQRLNQTRQIARKQLVLQSLGGG